MRGNVLEGEEGRIDDFALLAKALATNLLLPVEPGEVETGETEQKR